MAHFSYKTILCYLGWPVCKRNFVSFFTQNFMKRSKSKSQSVGRRGKNKNIFSKLYSTAKPTTQYIQYEMPKGERETLYSFTRQRPYNTKNKNIGEPFNLIPSKLNEAIKVIQKITL